MLKNVIFYGISNEVQELFQAIIALFDMFSNIDIVYVFTSLYMADESTTQARSNIARFGSQRVVLEMFYDYPILGIGWGEFGFYASEYYPDLAWRSSEIVNWGSNWQGGWPAPFGLLYRILAECGILGAIMWCVVWISILVEINSRYIIAKDKYALKCIEVCIIGVSISTFNMDILHFYPMWFYMAIVWSLMKKST